MIDKAKIEQQALIHPALEILWTVHWNSNPSKFITFINSRSEEIVNLIKLSRIVFQPKPYDEDTYPKLKFYLADIIETAFQSNSPIEFSGVDDIKDKGQRDKMLIDYTKFVRSHTSGVRNLTNIALDN